jgi:hypothetical protein
VALVNAYATTADLRSQLGDPGTSLDTAMLERALNSASRAVDHYTGRRFWADATLTARTYDGSGTERLLVDDISDRAGVVVKVGYDGATFTETRTAGVDFVLEPQNADASVGEAFAFWSLRAIQGRFWPKLPYLGPTVQVTAKFGWSAVPPEVNSATLLKAASLFKRKDAPFAVAGFNDFGVVRIGRNDPDVMDLLGHLVIPGF